MGKERSCRLVVDGLEKERHGPGAFRTVMGPQRGCWGLSLL
jgi:hypothetical protein